MNYGSFRTLSIDEIGGEAGDDQRCSLLAIRRCRCSSFSRRFVGISPCVGKFTRGNLQFDPRQTLGALGEVGGINPYKPQWRRKSLSSRVMDRCMQHLHDFWKKFGKMKKRKWGKGKLCQCQFISKIQ